MSDQSGGANWWRASDDKWYPPEVHPDYQPPPPPPASASESEDTPGDISPTPASEPEPLDTSVPDAPDYTLKVREGGKNGLVTVGDKGITRVFAKRIGKDDRQFIPFRQIQLVEHNRKKMGSDIVVVHLANQSLEWKVASDAEGFVDLVTERIS